MRHFKTSLMVSLFSLAMFLLWTASAGAAKNGNKPSANGSNTKGAFSTQVAELHTVVNLLQSANHDYKGHRAQAVHEIHQAIHALHPATNNNKTSAKGGKNTGRTIANASKNQTNGKNGAINEPQSVSDAQLRQAITQLNAVQGQLKSAPPAAIASIQNAVKQLQVALTIK